MRPNLEPYRALLNAVPEDRNGQWIFLRLDRKKETTDRLDRIKSLFKRFPGFYQNLINLISPVLPHPAMLRRFMGETRGLVLNIGSGNLRIAPGVVNVDMFDYDQVDIVADIHALPFADATVDGVVSIAVLEHVKEPDKVIREIFRVLKPGGRVFSLIPFMQPFHASPHDYQRYTLPGIRWLHRDFEEISAGVNGGPVSGFLWVLQEMIASLFSFGSQRLHNLLLILLMLLTWPCKFLDLIFRRLPTASNLASSFSIYARKPGG